MKFFRIKQVQGPDKFSELPNIKKRFDFPDEYKNTNKVHKNQADLIFHSLRGMDWWILIQELSAWNRKRVVVVEGGSMTRVLRCCIKGSSGYTTTIYIFVGSCQCVWRYQPWLSSVSDPWIYINSKYICVYIYIRIDPVCVYMHSMGFGTPEYFEWLYGHLGNSFVPMRHHPVTTRITHIIYMSTCTTVCMKPRDWSQICDFSTIHHISVDITPVDSWSFDGYIPRFSSFSSTTYTHTFIHANGPCWLWLLQFHIKSKLFLSNLFNPLPIHGNFSRFLYFIYSPFALFSPYIPHST